MRHFGLSLDFVRLYGGSLENLDYPIPGRVYSAKINKLLLKICILKLP
jgi:hypothetical protein